jgi:hypothetical protein
MPLVEFEPMIAGGGRPYIYALDRVTTGTGPILVTVILKYS